MSTQQSKSREEQMKEREEQLRKQVERIKEQMKKISHKIMVMSGKGGVGKTTVAVNLAYTMAMEGKRVGLLDIDLHGPNVAKMLGIEGEMLTNREGEIEPFEALYGLKVISLALILENTDEPVIWRGPLKTVAIRQFLGDVRWGNLDYLIIDSPPGTGDEPLSICQLIPEIDGTVIVTTPQDVAILDSTKAVMFARKLNTPIIGIIENMSGFVCPYCHRTINIFKKGGAEKAAQRMKVPFLGSISFDPKMVELGDAGIPLASLSETEESTVRKEFKSIVEKIERHKNENLS